MIWRQAAGRDAFRGPVSFPDADPGIVLGKELVELFLQLDGQGVATGEYAAQARQVRAIQIGVARNCLEERRHAGDEVGLRGADQLGVALDIEARHEDGRAPADQHGMDADSQAEAMEHRHRSQHLAVADLFMTHGLGLPGQRIEIQVGKHDALGHAGRAAGE